MSAKQYWEDNKDKYPYHATAMVGDPDPKELKKSGLIIDDFIACPDAGVCFWGFQTEVDRDNFIILFEGAQECQ